MWVPISINTLFSNTFSTCNNDPYSHLKIMDPD
jgi:hypothetical protein